MLQAALPAALPHLEPPQRADVSRALDQDIPEALGFIETSVTRMDHLIRAILHLSRLGRRDLHLESLDMPALVHGTIQTLAHQIAARQAQVTVDPLPTVTADRTAMEQIMGNLLANAVAYLVPGRPGEIVVTGERHADVTVFAVRDNGRGIAAEDIPKVFEPFRRVGRQDVPGEGMGLAYVRMLVRRHGGEIRCHSTLGVGTTFTFTIAHQIAGGAPVPSKPSMTIVLVEDDPGHARLIERNLRRALHHKRHRHAQRWPAGGRLPLQGAHVRRGHACPAAAPAPRFEPAGA